MLVYLDNSATTPPYKEVTQTVTECHDDNYGNPSSLHRMGMKAEKAVKAARKIICTSLKAEKNEFFFTSGGTESNNTAVFGAVDTLKRYGDRIITSSVEHPSILNVCKALEKKGFDVKYLNVNDKGRIDINQLNEYYNDKTILISVMHVNNEMGTVQPIEEIAGYKKKNEKVLFHVDAVQSYGKIEVFPGNTGIDLLSVSAHKLHGPKGIGGLYINRKVNIPPLMFGGQQENMIRSGTENVPGIAGFGKAVELSFSEFQNRIKRTRKVKEYLTEGIKNAIKDIRINSYEDQRCAPHIVNISFAGVRGEVLLHMLEQADIYISTGSACSAKKRAKSHVLKASGLSDTEIDGAVRFSFSEFNSIDQMDYVLEHLKKSVERIRKIMRK